MKELTEKSKTTFDILITREGEKPKSIDDINIKSFLKTVLTSLRSSTMENIKSNRAKVLKLYLNQRKCQVKNFRIQQLKFSLIMKPNAMNRTTICLVLSENYKKGWN